MTTTYTVTLPAPRPVVNGWRVLKVTLVPKARPLARPRVYCWLADESVLANLTARHARPTVAWAPVARWVLEHAVQSFGGPSGPALALLGSKLVWDQHAGCDCGCSPGFVARLGAEPVKLWPYDISTLLQPEDATTNGEAYTAL